MSTNLIIRPKKQIRLNKIIEFLGNNRSPIFIRENLNISRAQYYRDIKDIQKEMFNPSKTREKAMKILAIRESLISETLSDYRTIKDDYPAKVATCKLLKEQLNDLEVSYQRLGLLPLVEEAKPEENMFAYPFFEKRMDELTAHYNKVLAKRNEKLTLSD